MRCDVTEFRRFMTSHLTLFLLCAVFDTVEPFRWCLRGAWYKPCGCSRRSIRDSLHRINDVAWGGASAIAEGFVAAPQGTRRSLCAAQRAKRSRRSRRKTALSAGSRAPEKRPVDGSRARRVRRVRASQRSGEVSLRKQAKDCRLCRPRRVENEVRNPDASVPLMPFSPFAPEAYSGGEWGRFRLIYAVKRRRKTTSRPALNSSRFAQIAKVGCESP